MAKPLAAQAFPSLLSSRPMSTVGVIAEAAAPPSPKQPQRREGGKGFYVPDGSTPKRAKSGPSNMDKIEKAINESLFTWRKPSSIAKDLKLDIKEVVAVLTNRSAFIQSKNLGEDGIPFFTTKSKYRETTPLLSVILNSISGEAPLAKKG